MMIERLGSHRANQANVISDRGDMRNIIGKLRARLSIAFELARACEHRRGGLDECQVEVLGERGWQRFTVLPLQFRFWVIEVDLARPAFHKEEDYAFCFRREVREFGSEWIGLRQIIRR